MNEYIETAIKVKDAISEFIPAKLSVIIKLAELAFDTFSKRDTSLKALYKRAFKEAVENVAKEETIGNVRELLNNCKNINSFEDVQDLTGYLKKVSLELGLSFTENDFIIIICNIVEKFENILLEEKYDKIYKWFLMCKKPYVLDNDISYIKEMLEEIYERESQLETDNKSYAQEFVKPLFRHRKDEIITLKDVFVASNVTMKNNTYNVIKVLRNFVKGKDDVLFLEGCGGYGKSSIVSFLAYNHLFNNTNPDISFLANKQLLIIRLRDIQEYDKIKAIREKINNIDAIEDDSILIFDGLDELCMMDKSSGSTIAADIIKEFSYYNRKIIITTRPTCMDYGDIYSLRITYNIAEICCFDEVQRRNFADNFAQKDKNHIETIEYVKNLPLEKQKNESIYGSPFLLYLILSGGIREEEKNNSWLLMHRLFHDDLFNPPYSHDRGIDDYTADKIYQFNCDIAYEMFKTGNKKLFMTSDELKTILPDDDVKNTVKESHGLYSYMRKSTEGAVEFVHNHVRDYFLCEKVLREINIWYSDTFVNGYKVAMNLGELLRYGYFTEEVKLFIMEAIQYSMSIHQNENLQQVAKYGIYKTILDQCDKRPLHMIFDWFYSSGGIITYDCSNTYAYMKSSHYAINNSAYIYKIIYAPHLKVGKYLYWVSDNALREPVMNSIFEMVKQFLDRAYLSHADLHRADLKEANLKGADLSHANLSGADLSGANLSMALLFKADLNKTDFYNTDLSGADLRSAKNISTAKFLNTKYNSNTKFPKNFVVLESEFVKIK